MLGIGNVGIILVDEGVSKRVGEGVNVSGEVFTTVVTVVCAAAGCKVVTFSSGSPDELLLTSVEITLAMLETSILEPDKKNNSSENIFDTCKYS